MSDSLATLTDKLQALLLDDGSIFADASCTAAIRQTLQVMNLNLPVQAATLIDAVTDQYQYELTTALAGAVPLQITDVLLEDPAGNEYDTPIAFDSYMEDERWFFRLRTPQPTGNTLIVRFTQAHTINGLDSATESTLPAEYDVVLLDGAAAHACSMAAAGNIETYNLEPNVPKNYQLAASRFQRAFHMGLEALRIRRRPQRSVPTQPTWEDAWHGFLQ
jgi:hypothetical protein